MLHEFTTSDDEDIFIDVTIGTNTNGFTIIENELVHIHQTASFTTTVKLKVHVHVGV